MQLIGVILGLSIFMIFLLCICGCVCNKFLKRTRSRERRRIREAERERQRRLDSSRSNMRPHQRNNYGDNDLPMYHITLEQYTNNVNENGVDNKSLNGFKFIDDLPSYEQYIVSKDNKQVQNTSL